MATTVISTPPLCPLNAKLQDDRYAAGIRSRDLQPSLCYRNRVRSDVAGRIFHQRSRCLEGRQKSLSRMTFSADSKKSRQFFSELSAVSALHESQEYLACNSRRSSNQLVLRRKAFMGLSSQRQSLLTNSNFLLWQRPRKLSDFHCLLKRSAIAPSATVGPDEPHVASTAWPEDGLLEKQGLGIWEHGIKGTDLEGFLSSRIPSHPKLYRGQLKNGLRYVILPNKVPPNRFEAHMEIHVGSVDEDEDEQGIAHMIEHVAFLGSKKREKLLGTGARSNAYTDFHHTVFHVHSPFMSKGV